MSEEDEQSEEAKHSAVWSRCVLIQRATKVFVPGCKILHSAIP